MTATGRRRFRPSLPLTLLTLVLIALMLKLAFWQFDRAAAKRALEEAAHAGMNAAAVTLRTTAAATAVRPFERAALIGEYDAAAEILLDNRIEKKRGGFHVVTPFLLADGGAIMVKRGWLGDDGRRQILPDAPPPPDGRVTISGIFYGDDRNVFVLSEDRTGGKLRQRLILSDYAEEIGLPLLGLLLIKDDTVQPPLSPISIQVNFKSARSTAYAWQWLSFCGLAMVFYLLLGIRRQ